MASWQSPTIHSTGEIFSVSDNNILANNEFFLYQKPYGFYYNSVATNVPDSTWTQITLTGTEAANYGFSVAASVNVTLPLTGTYAVSWSVGCVNTTGSNFTQVKYNGATWKVGSIGGANSVLEGHSAGSGAISANATDTLSLWTNQTSGGAVNTVNTSVNTFLSAWFIGSQ